MLFSMRLILASGSPRRRELLLAAGFAFDVSAVEVDERRTNGEAPAAYVERLARAKAHAAAAAQRDPDTAVLGADTVVVVDDEVLGKPRDEVDATRMLRLLSGRSHEVLTGVAVIGQGGTVSRVERTTVWFAPLSDRDIAWYVASGEPMDKAGAYAIQALASRFIPRIEGSYTNVVGLPVTTVVELLEKAGLSRLPRPPAP
jgi:septum formation protein